MTHNVFIDVTPDSKLKVYQLPFNSFAFNFFHWRSKGNFSYNSGDPVHCSRPQFVPLSHSVALFRVLPEPQMDFSLGREADKVLVS